MNIRPDMTLTQIIEQNGVEVMSLPLSVLWAIASASDKSKNATAFTVLDFYEKFYKPEVSLAKGVAEGTLECRETALRYWVEITGNPTLDKVNKSVMCQYVVGLRNGSETRKPMAPATIRKHCRAVMSVLDYAGPRTERNRDAKGLIPLPPAFPVVEVPDPDVSAKTPDMEEFEKILKTVKTANADGVLYEGIKKGDWFSAAYRFLWNTGLRYADLMSARWKDIKKRKGRYVLTIRGDAEKTGKEKYIPLNSTAVAILDEMPRGHDEIFYWPKSERALYDNRLRLIRRAGLPTTAMGTFHAIRRMVATYVPDATLVLGHTTAATTRMHYQAIERKARALESLEQPVFS